MPDKDICIDFEITRKCNNNCLFCYNVWKTNTSYPDGELSFVDIKKIFERVIKESGCGHIAITGGEPMLREDIFQIISFFSSLGLEVALITNGTLLSKEAVKKCVDAGVDLFEVQLLSYNKKMHNYLCRNDAFDKVVGTIREIKLNKAKVATAFVATKINIKDAVQTAGLALELGADAVYFNRFNPGGEGLKHLDEFLLTKELLNEALGKLNKIAQEHKIKFFTPIPIPPCIIDHSLYKNIYMDVFCTAGRYYTIDPLGNLRMCNHSPTILGNLAYESFPSLVKSKFSQEFKTAIPETCKDCRHLPFCRGGCKAAAQVCYGNIYLEEPLVFYQKNKRTENLCV
ncbi:MAG: radical SAM protein [Nitrospirota bacterium]